MSYFSRTRKQDEIEAVMKGGTSDGARRGWETRRSAGQANPSYGDPERPVQAGTAHDPAKARANAVALRLNREFGASDKPPKKSKSTFIYGGFPDRSLF